MGNGVGVGEGVGVAVGGVVCVAVGVIEGARDGEGEGVGTTPVGVAVVVTVVVGVAVSGGSGLGDLIPFALSRVELCELNSGSSSRLSHDERIIKVVINKNFLVTATHSVHLFIGKITDFFKPFCKVSNKTRFFGRFLVAGIHRLFTGFEDRRSLLIFKKCYGLLIIVSSIRGPFSEASVAGTYRRLVVVVVLSSPLESIERQVFVVASQAPSARSIVPSAVS